MPHRQHLPGNWDLPPVGPVPCPPPPPRCWPACVLLAGVLTCQEALTLSSFCSLAVSRSTATASGSWAPTTAAALSPSLSSSPCTLATTRPGFRVYASISSVVLTASSSFAHVPLCNSTQYKVSTDFVHTYTVTSI